MDATGYDLINVLDLNLAVGPIMATVVSLVRNDPDTVEITHGVITKTTDDVGPIGDEKVLFEDGSYAYVQDIISTRLEMT